jgi:hypothetical protein
MSSAWRRLFAWQQGMPVGPRPGHNRNEFYKCLMGNPQNLLKEPLPQEGACGLALLWKSGITSVNENVRINEGSHDRKVPLASIRDFGGEPLNEPLSLIALAESC